MSYADVFVTRDCRLARFAENVQGVRCRIVASSAELDQFGGKGEVSRVDTAFQPIDTQNILVLGADETLWLERAPFGKLPAHGVQIDANVSSFHAVDLNNVLVEGTDGNLWNEHPPFGTLPPPNRDLIDGNVMP